MFYEKILQGEKKEEEEEEEEEEGNGVGRGEGEERGVGGMVPSLTDLI